jgi:two-component system response regulator FixJ
LVERRIALPVIVITGQAEVPIAVQAMKAGAVDFIEKPYAEEVILASIRQALARAEQTQRARSASADAAERIGQLTPREKEVLDQLVLGHPNKVIAYKLSISPRTVEIHRARIMQKMEARSLSDLVRLALEAGQERSGNTPA